jgi:hypothetical protein
MFAEEEWRDVVGYEGLYQASSLGRIRRIAPGRGPTRPGYILKPKVAKSDCVHVNLYKGGKERTHQIHRLVAAAFYGSCPEGHEVNHKNGSRLDNRLENLEYVTSHENILHARVVLGRSIGSPKLTAEDVREIRRLYAPVEFGAKRLGRLFGVNSATIRAIIRRKTWKYLD